MSKRTVLKAFGIVAIALLLLLLAGGATGWYLVFHDRGINLSLDPAIIAASETNMWKAYYTRDTTALGFELVGLLREQFGLSYASAALVGEDMARAAMVFAASKPNYEADALTHLVSAYTRLAELSSATWNPEDAALLELQWWVDRRTPGRDDTATVGASIAALYALLYGQSNARIDEAGRLRAEAAALRDAGGQNADWTQVESMLNESYTQLLQGVSG